ncbi:MAG: hypothetical protein K5Q68_18600, partial [Roseococcus sp.]|nr:hypothetical protein [Roseococcus sp.]
MAYTFVDLAPIVSIRGTPPPVLSDGYNNCMGVYFARKGDSLMPSSVRQQERRGAAESSLSDLVARFKS